MLSPEFVWHYWRWLSRAVGIDQDWFNADLHRHHTCLFAAAKSFPWETFSNTNVLSRTRAEGMCGLLKYETISFARPAKYSANFCCSIFFSTCIHEASNENNVPETRASFIFDALSVINAFILICRASQFPSICNITVSINWERNFQFVISLTSSKQTLWKKGLSAKRKV